MELVPDRALNTNELHTILSQHLPGIFRGVYPSDHLPADSVKFSLPWTILLNTDCSHRDGMHWQCWFKSKDGVIHHFCSFGNPPKKLKWLKFLKDNSKNGHWIYQRRKIQGTFTHYCGHHSLMFAILRNKTPLTISDYRLMLDIDDANVQNKLNVLLLNK